MNHRDITRFRDRARFARQHGEKALTTPDELDTLLDLALALPALKAAIDGPHPANSGLDSCTLAYMSARLDEYTTARTAR